MAGKRQMSHQPARSPRKRVLKTAGQSALPLSLGKLWSKRSQKPLPSRQHTRGGLDSQRRLTNGKSWLTNLAGFCSQMSGCADKG